jgi:hypothetical protein
MSTTVRSAPRFLPTLTEVVHPSGSAETPVPATPEFEEIVQTVMHQVDAMMERRISEEARALARRLVDDELESLRGRLRQELELIVRQTVTEAIGAD